MLARGVDVVTVQAWMGHASVATTNLYLHHLGTSADKAGLDRLNRPGHTGAQIGQMNQNYMMVSRRCCERQPWSDAGSTGWS